MDADRTAVRRPIPWVVDVHAADAAVIFGQLMRLRDAPHVNLSHLARFEARLASHLDGLRVAGSAGVAAIRTLLADDPHAGAVGVGVTLALDVGDVGLLERILVPARAVQGAGRAIAAALSWTDPVRLRGVVARLALSEDRAERIAAIDASRTHLAPARAMLAKCLGDDDPAVVAAALEVAAALGMRDLVESFDTSSAADVVSFAHVRASAMMGVDVATPLEHCAMPGRHQVSMMQVALRAADVASARALLDRIAGESPTSEALVAGAGIVGDPMYIPWLVGRMRDPKLARLAGEAFTMITGADLSLLDLERRPPEDAGDISREDPRQDDVGADPDDGLPWPDPDRVAEWWKSNARRFPTGQRCFMGRPPLWQHCTEVLGSGFQRQRSAAAIWRCVLRPGTPLFPTDAPVARQRGWLGSAALTPAATPSRRSSET